MSLEGDRIKEVILKHALRNALSHGGKALESAVISKVLGEYPELRKYAKQVVAMVKEVVDYVNSLPVEEQLRIARERFPEVVEARRPEKVPEARTLPPLPNVEKYGTVRTRFAPNPDFYIHLGNARPAILSYEYARMYRGAFILRFEDTDPRIKTPLPEAYKAIREDLRWLGLTWDEEYIQSLRMEIYYRVAKELIARGGAYVDLCPREEFRKFKAQRRPCPHRDQDPSKALELFDRMLSGYFGEGEAVLRVKTDLQSPDPSLIDWVAFRIIDTSSTPHPLTGDRYIVWPTYNFAAGVDDRLMGVTHILRGREHAVNTLKQLYLYRALGWEYPEVVNLGRLKLEGMILSKSLIKSIIRKSSGRVSVDDLRFGTLRSLRRRGVLPEVIREIMLEVGVKASDATISWENIASLNRKKIDPVTPRLMAVVDPVEVAVWDIPESPDLRVLRLSNHPSNESLGVRTVEVGSGNPVRVYLSRADAETLIKEGSIRLLEFCNIALKSYSRELVEAYFTGADVEQARRSGLKIVQWVPAKDFVRVSIVKPEGLKLKVLKAFAESSLLQQREGSVVQFVRVGFVKVEKAESRLRSVRVAFMHE